MRARQVIVARRESTLCGRDDTVVQICHTREDCAAVLPVFARVHDRIFGPGRMLAFGSKAIGECFRGESRDASLYLPARRHRASLRHLPELRRATDVCAGRRAALEHGEDRLHL